MVVKFLIYTTLVVNFISFSAFADEFDDPTTMMPIPADHYSLPNDLTQNEIVESVTQFPGQSAEDGAIDGNEEVTPVPLEITSDDEHQDESSNPEVVHPDHPVEEKATWNINEYMHGCDHDVRDCVEAAKQLKPVEGANRDELLFDCIEAHECMPLKRWSCDNNLNFVNRHEELTNRCLKWGLYQYQEQEVEQEQPLQPEVEREL